MNERIPQLAALVDTVNTQLRQWVSKQNTNLGSERSRLDQKARKYGEAKEARNAFISSLAYWSVGAILFIALLSASFHASSTWSSIQETWVKNLYIAGGLLMFPLGLALVIGLFVLFFRSLDALESLGTRSVSPRERERLDQQQTKIGNKQREVEGHLEAARQALASWPPTRVVPFF